MMHGTSASDSGRSRSSRLRWSTWPIAFTLIAMAAGCGSPGAVTNVGAAADSGNGTSTTTTVQVSEIPTVLRPGRTILVDHNTGTVLAVMEPADPSSVSLSAEDAIADVRKSTDQSTWKLDHTLLAAYTDSASIPPPGDTLLPGPPNAPPPASVTSIDNRLAWVVVLTTDTPVHPNPTAPPLPGSPPTSSTPGFTKFVSVIDANSRKFLAAYFLP